MRIVLAAVIASLAFFAVEVLNLLLTSLLKGVFPYHEEETLVRPRSAHGGGLEAWLRP